MSPWSMIVEHLLSFFVIMVVAMDSVKCYGADSKLDRQSFSCGVDKGLQLHL